MLASASSGQIFFRSTWEREPMNLGTLSNRWRGGIVARCRWAASQAPLELRREDARWTGLVRLRRRDERADATPADLASGHPAILCSCGPSPARCSTAASRADHQPEYYVGKAMTVVETRRLRRPAQARDDGVHDLAQEVRTHLSATCWARRMAIISGIVDTWSRGLRCFWIMRALPSSWLSPRRA